MAASGLDGRPVIHVPENGLISLNLPLDLRGLAEGATLRLIADNASCVFAFAGLSQSFSVGR